jgi:hypothetical protein
MKVGRCGERATQRTARLTNSRTAPWIGRAAFAEVIARC